MGGFLSLAFSLGVRMKTTVMVILLHMACCLGAPLSGQSGNSSSPEGELRAVMAELHKAALEGDTEKTVSLMTDEYVQTDISGHFQEKTEWLNTYSKPLAELIKAGKFRWEVYEKKEFRFVCIAMLRS